jgi:glycosyltransferase involved in cell wall biosynthesis
MQVAVFHPGTQHSWQTALALQQLGRLAWYATSIFHQPERWPYRLTRFVPAPLAQRLEAEFRRFEHSGLDPGLVRTGGLAEWAERIAARAGLRGLAQRIDAFGNRRFVHQIAADLAAPDPFALWGYNGSSLTAFEAAKHYGRHCILDRTIGDYRVYNAAMDEVAERYGAWFLPTERRVSADQIERDQREYELADTILLGCETAAETVRRYADPAKVRVLNYCFDEALFAAVAAPRPVARDRPVRFLFMGQAIPRKGIHLLFEAIARIPASQAELTIVGDLRVPTAAFAPYADRVTHIPTVARSEVPALMAAHHVLVQPSYFEGSSLTLLEALAAGLAIVQSRMAGDGVTPETGLLLDRLDTDTLEAALLSVIVDRDRLDCWRAAAQAEGARYSFTRHREGIAQLLEELGL